MSEKNTVGVGLVGLGTIGTGVAKVLQKNAAIIKQRLGASLQLVRIADLDLETDRGIDLTGIQFDSDSEGLVSDPDVDIVIELVGGYDFAKHLLLAAKLTFLLPAHRSDPMGGVEDPRTYGEGLERVCLRLVHGYLRAP